MSSKSYYNGLLRYTTLISALIFGCLALFVLSLVIFNWYLLNSLSGALVEFSKLESGEILSQQLSSNAQNELGFFTNDPHAYREYIAETKSFLYFLLKPLAIFAMLLCISLQLCLRFNKKFCSSDL